MSFAFTGYLFKSYFGRNELNPNEIALNYSDIDVQLYPRDNVLIALCGMRTDEIIAQNRNSNESIILVESDKVDLRSLLVYINENFDAILIVNEHKRNSSGIPAVALGGDSTRT